MDYEAVIRTLVERSLSLAIRAGVIRSLAISLATSVGSSKPSRERCSRIY